MKVILVRLHFFFRTALPFQNLKELILTWHFLGLREPSVAMTILAKS